mgnify:CR=1 FL=1
MQTNCANMSSTNEDPDVNMANRKILCGMVAEIDDGVKSIRLQLEKLEEWDQTLLLVMSDNGGIVIHGSINRPLRGEKADDDCRVDVDGQLEVTHNNLHVRFPSDQVITRKALRKAPTILRGTLAQSSKPRPAP